MGIFAWAITVCVRFLFFCHMALSSLQVSRTIALCMLGHSLGRRFVLEQPLGSLMERHPRFVEMLERIDITRHSTSMDQFASETRKPTWLYSNCDTIRGIEEYGPPLPCSSTSSEDRVTAISYQDCSSRFISYGCLCTCFRSAPDNVRSVCFHREFLLSL